MEVSVEYASRMMLQGIDPLAWGDAAPVVQGWGIRE